MNNTDQNDAEGLAQIMRTGWYRSVDVKSIEVHRARALLGARAQLVGMTTRYRSRFAACSRPSVCCLAPCEACHSIGA
jgi:transposase